MINSLNDTIAAVATPVGIGGIAVIRISGPDAKQLLSEVFSRNGEYDHAKMYFGKIVGGGKVLDEGYAVFFENPKSYTGEDTAELHVHGSRIGALKIMDLLLKKGARQAEPGEFSKRAFINGKIDLTKAQAISDYISAGGELCLKQSAAQMAGELKLAIDENISKLTDIIAREEAAIEYPDEDIDGISVGATPQELLDLSYRIERLAHTYKTGMRIKEGVKVVIAGKPNVGKSSILNALCGRTRAIVSDVAGTTRDVVTSKIDIDGMIFELYDTAGIRQTEDKIENLGVELSERTIGEADLALLVVDCTRPIDQLDKNALRAIKNTKIDYYIVLNKIDSADKILNKEGLEDFDGAHIIETSALSKKDIQNLKGELKKYAAEDYNADGMIVINLRQAQLLEEAAQHLKNAAVSLSDGWDLDCVLTDLKEALYNLGEITGRNVTEDVVNRVFEKFCLGK